MNNDEISKWLREKITAQLQEDYARLENDIQSFLKRGFVLEQLEIVHRPWERAIVQLIQ